MNSTPLTEPRLETPRLVLDPPTLSDVPLLTALVGRREIADTTATIPHPYTEDHARAFLSEQAGLQRLGKSVALTMRLKPGSSLIGMVGLRDIDREHEQAEMGFWVGVDYWQQGYATEAARALVAYAFDSLGLNRVYAHHMLRNPASGRVLEKVGMKREGLLRQRVKKWGAFEDVVVLAILRDDWRSLRDGHPGE